MTAERGSAPSGSPALAGPDLRGADLRSEVLRELFLLAPVLERRKVEGMRRRNLTPPRARLLRTLGEGGPQVMSCLSRALDVTPRAVTALVDSLEADGLVRRCEHPTDRRATVVELTADGRRTFRELREGHRRLAEDLLGALSERDLAAGLRVACACAAPRNCAGADPAGSFVQASGVSGEGDPCVYR